MKLPSPRPHKFRFAILATAAFLSTIAIAAEVPAAEPNAAQLLKTAGIDAGLVVHLGATDGQLEAGLTNGGRVLMDGLALTDADRDRARQTLLAKGL